MTKSVGQLEERRLKVQAELDAAKSQAERNRMGQFATPTGLAVQILRYAGERLDETGKVRFIDPSIGTGSFYSALLDVFPEDRLECAIGYEIDPHYGAPAKKLWSEAKLDVRLEDFTLAEPPANTKRFNLLICNPPYVRHHHIANEEKRRLKGRARKACGVEISGLAGLYCYFLGLCHEWMAEGGLAGWLIPSEFMDVNYGASLKLYLLDKVKLLHIHRFDPNEVQFGDALVSSSVVWFNKEEPPHNHQVRMTYGGSLQQPRLERLVPMETLRHSPKWTQYPMKENRQAPDSPTLSDFFSIKRGLATGCNRYFILSADEIRERGLPAEAFRPILPGPRHVPTDEVAADEKGCPVLERRLFLLDCQLPEEYVESRYPALRAYLKEGRAQGVADRYLCRRRSPWYSQERRPAAPFLCTYLGRSGNGNRRPFRFILNHSQATAPNVYLMLYPRESLAEALKKTPQLKGQIWEFLNSISPEMMLGEGRVYGGGLHKLEPRELGRVPATALAALLPEPGWSHERKQLKMFEAARAYVGDRQQSGKVL